MNVQGKKHTKVQVHRFSHLHGASIIILASKHHSVGEFIAEQIKQFPFREVVFVLGLNS